MPGVSGSGSRYERSMSGMVGAMLVTLAVILAFVVFRAVNRNDADISPEAVDYLEVVEGAQQGGVTVTYPPELPDGWIATRAAFEAEPGRVWALSMLTDDEEFVGVRQSEAELEDLVEKYVDEDAEEGDPVTLDSPLAKEWTTFTDSGGDYAVAADVRGSFVLVVGSAGKDAVEDLAASLVMTPVG